jgi:hypothetical protein
MKVSQYVNFSQEIEIEVGVDDIRAAFAEELAEIKRPVSDHAIKQMLNVVGQFFNALTEDQIATLTPQARSTVQQYLVKQAQRFALAEPSVNNKLGEHVAEQAEGNIVDTVVERSGSRGDGPEIDSRERADQE